MPSPNSITLFGLGFTASVMLFLSMRRLFSTNSSGFIALYVTVPSHEVGKKIAEKVVGEKYAACVNIVDHVESFYRWEGKVTSDNELLLIIKTRESLFDKIQSSVQSIHPYEVPEIVSFPLRDIDDKYKKWLDESTTL